MILIVHKVLRVGRGALVVIQTRRRDAKYEQIFRVAQGQDQEAVLRLARLDSQVIAAPGRDQVGDPVGALGRAVEIVAASESSLCMVRFRKNHKASLFCSISPKIFSFALNSRPN